MNPLFIERKDNAPGVTLNPDQGVLEIVGESRPEDVRKFYEPVIQWIESWGKELAILSSAKKFEFNFVMDYFNSSSAKYIMSIILKLNEIQNQCKLAKIEINWKYEISDEDMLSAGQEFQNLTQIPFNFVVVKIQR